VTKHGTLAASEIRGTLMPDTDNLWNKLYQATHVLATGRGDIKERLHGAALALALLQREDLPRELQDEFSQLVAQMTRLDRADDEGALSPTLRVIDDNEAVELAGRNLDLYTTIATRYVNRK
jgi:hypothetical protein